MILIISNAHYETPTDQVIDWLLYYKAEFIRLNAEDITESDNLFSIDFENIIVGGQSVCVNDINVVWYRRWYRYEIGIKPSSKHRRQVIREVCTEGNSILLYLYNVLRAKVWLSDPEVNILHNKLYALYLANRFGLKIPPSLVTNDRSCLSNFFNNCDGRVITKPLTDPSPYFDSKGNSYNDYTEMVPLSLIKSLPERIFPSLFQEGIDVEFEIRAFYLDGELYSTALVNASTTDIKLSFGKTLKFICYELPASIKDQLHRLMLGLGLNTGSIDLLKDKSGEYYFLEVNPVGQFTGYGFPCNYYLDKKIAEWLLARDNKTKTNSHEKKATTVYDRI